MKTVTRISADIAAKLNLSLKITGKRDGMHTLDMTLCSVNLYDTAEFVPGEGGLKLSAESGLKNFDEERFLRAIRPAAERICARFGVFGSIKIIKRIPLGAGMGGSSAVIAGICKAAEAYALGTSKDYKPADNAFLLSLGSDVPYMYAGGSARVSGIGESVRMLPFKKLYFAVALPSSGVDSGRAYAEFDRLTYGKPEKNKSFTGGLFVNDLEQAAVILNPEIGTARAALFSAGAENAVMSGSGSAYSAVFETEKKRAEFLESLNYPTVLILESLPSEKAQMVRLD